MKVYFLSNANLATGGTELLHQFSHCLSSNGIENYMIYPDSDGINCPTPPPFMKYGVKYVTKYIDAPDSVLVLAETQIHYIDECQKGTVMIWWLSVDNYFNSYKNYITEENYDIFHLAQRQNVLHFVQSYYAENFVKHHLSLERCHFLMDYINDDITNWANAHKDSYVRQNICLYNPKKGYNLLEPIIKACRDDIKWIPLINMSPTQMADTMCRAKLYIDFGGHPGKDRIPREAAICGCCVLTNRLGSAAYQDDVNIPEQFKIDNISDTNHILGQIYELIDNYDTHISEYSTYRNIIRLEKENFLRDVQDTVILLKSAVACKTNFTPTIDLQPHADIQNSIMAVADKIIELTKDARTSCSSNDSSKLMSNLLNIDYLIQLIRETIYYEINDIR